MPLDYIVPPRPKLGLALAGGGFRASLFHVGVLRRLAELDVLRRVEVLSTVSGGSITGALYVLLLKKYLEDVGKGKGGKLSQGDYVELVQRLESIHVRGIQKNLRTRLFMNPLGILLVLLTTDSIGRRMGRLYERYLFRNVVRELRVDSPPRWRPVWLCPGQIRMEELVIKPGGNGITNGLDDYNSKQLETGGSVVTTIKINATSLNSGGRFFFSAREFGDWYLGYFRRSEFDELLARKALLALSDEELRQVARGTAEQPEWNRTRYFSDNPWRKRSVLMRAAALAYRRRIGEELHDDPSVWTDDWKPLFDAAPPTPGSGSGSSLLERLEQAAPGLLRTAKISAWYVRIGLQRTPPIRGGFNAEAHEAHRTRFWSALHNIDPGFDEVRTDFTKDSTEMEDLLLDYVLELYWLRSAECVSGNIEKDWQKVRLGHAVGASACFPPVFPPFLMYGVYDDLHVSRLGLTDGGVYDNSGVTALLDEGCNQIISSDTRGLSFVTPSSPTTRVGLAGRIPTLLMNALGGVQRGGLRARRRVSRKLDVVVKLEPCDEPWASAKRKLTNFRAVNGLNSLAYFHIASPRVAPFKPAAGARHASPAGPAPLPNPQFKPIAVAGLRTDLDGFGDVEVAVLVNHGYDLADRYVRRYAPEILARAGAGVAAPQWPRPFDDDPQAKPGRLANILQVGKARAFRVLKLRGGPARSVFFQALAWGFTLAVTLSAVVLAWWAGLTLRRMWDAVGMLSASAASVVASATGWIQGWARLPGVELWDSRLVLVGVLGLSGLALLALAGRLPRSPASQGGAARLRRRLVTTWKWVRVLRGNALWPVFGLPLILALTSALLAAFSYVFYYLPFKAATQLKRSYNRSTQTLRRR